MTLIKFSGFYTSSLFLHDSSNITNINLKIYCSSVGSAVANVDAYAFTGNSWDESTNPTSVNKTTHIPRAASNFQEALLIIRLI